MSEPAGDKPKTEPTAPPRPTFAWMGRSRQWNTRARPDARGLTLGALNIGVYGEIPEHWDDQTRRPRGSIPRPGVPPIGQSVRSRHELWADSAADLYEEGIQRRWVPASDVPWASITPLPDDVEAAVCQLCTELCQYANTEMEAISTWQEDLAYGYHEVKMFLAGNTFDAARHFEAFRKRALVNGGGLGLENKGDVNRMILESRGGWTEAVAYLYLLRGTFTLHLYRVGFRHAHNEAERVLFGRAMQDKARHLTYGLDHLKYATAHQDDQAQILNTLLAVGEGMVARELQDPALTEALALLIGNGIEGARNGGLRAAVRGIGDWARYYLDCCDWIGVPRRQAVHPRLKKYLEA